MANKCSECTYLKIDGYSDPDSNGRFYCEKKYERHLATDIECSRFCRAYSRSYGTIKNAEDYSNSHSSSSGCFLTTMMCNILKMPDDNPFLNKMRSFRNNYLQKNEKYKEILVQYDIVGPMIAKNLNNDKKRVEIAATYFYTYIKQIIKYLDNKEYEKAIMLYIDMTTNLINHYNLGNVEINVEDIKAADIEKSGHGVYIKKFN